MKNIVHDLSVMCSALTMDFRGRKRRKLAQGLDLVISRKELSAQFGVFGRAIGNWCRERQATIVPVIEGGAYSAHRLIEHFDYDLRVRQASIVAKSYGDSLKQEQVRVYHDWIQPERDITDRNILLIDDVLDSGETIKAVIHELSRFKPASIDSFFMIRKDRVRSSLHIPSAVMFELDDLWILGAGLDDAGLYRQMPYIASRSIT